MGERGQELLTELPDSRLANASGSDSEFFPRSLRRPRNLAVCWDFRRFPRWLTLGRLEHPQRVEGLRNQVR